MVTDFHDRMANTRRFDAVLTPFLEQHGIRSHEFGQTRILHGSTEARTTLRSLMATNFTIEDASAAFFVKYSPDFLCEPDAAHNEPFFMDTKASVVPVIFESKVQELRECALKNGSQDLKRRDIGEIEREAWDVYTKLYPSQRVAVCFAAPYCHSTIVMEWCSNINDIFRFDKDRNTSAGGSQTPHVNIHLGEMRPLSQFLRDELGVQVDPSAYKELLEMIREWPVVKPRRRITWYQFRKAYRELRDLEGCPWLKAQVPDDVLARIDFSEKIT